MEFSEARSFCDGAGLSNRHTLSKLIAESSVINPRPRIVLKYMTPGYSLHPLRRGFAQPASFDVASVRPSKFLNAEAIKEKKASKSSPGSVTLRSTTLTTCCDGHMT